MKNLFIIMICSLIAGIFIIVYQTRDNLKEYNKHVCAVYGYYDDCKTPLPEELRLK